MDQKAGQTPKTLLIVEDDTDICNYFKIVLHNPGIDILTACDGEDALRQIDTGRKIDLILLDVVMPVMDGVEFFRILRGERKSSIPVILSSVDEGMAKKIQAIGPVEGIYLKGHSGSELKEMVAGLLGL